MEPEQEIIEYLCGCKLVFQDGKLIARKKCNHPRCKQINSKKIKWKKDIGKKQ
ncbi:MAG: hypothetical protein ACOC5T_01645 [Elusimicrobiota bacterium]